MNYFLVSFPIITRVLSNFHLIVMLFLVNDLPSYIAVVMNSFQVKMPSSCYPAKIITLNLTQQNIIKIKRGLFFKIDIFETTFS